MSQNNWADTFRFVGICITFHVLSSKKLQHQSSTPSEQFLNYSWIEFRQLNSSIFGSELPVNFNTFRIAITCPSTNLLFETFHIRKRFSQSLAAHDANLYLSVWECNAIQITAPACGLPLAETLYIGRPGNGY